MFKVIVMSPTKREVYGLCNNSFEQTFAHKFKCHFRKVNALEHELLKSRDAHRYKFAS